MRATPDKRKKPGRLGLGSAPIQAVEMDEATGRAPSGPCFRHHADILWAMNSLGRKGTRSIRLTSAL